MPPVSSAAPRVSTVDDREFDHYDALADTWWDPTGPFWPLHRLNELRVHWIVDQLTALGMAEGAAAQPLAGLSVLDLGCGGGILAESLARLGGQVHGVDVVPRNIATAKHHSAASGLNVSYAVTSAEELAEAGRRYDLVCNMEVVEHVANLETFMACAGSLVRPGGAMFVATINRTLRAWLTAIIGAEYILRWLPRGTHRYRLLRRPEEVAHLLAASGLRQTAITGVRVNPLNRKFSFTDDVGVNYMLCAVKAVKP
ncbi:MAG: bifunctional 2-polyprenyl-6-hydroxyphenol methylase/3-demethylubiquinol 3-O-methyltransferase UbiG [Pseudomonadota bacterium]